MIKEGDNAPDFTAKDENGNDVKLSDFKGKKVALFFYPKDDTPGWTKEACSFRDANDELEKAGITALGVSTDNEKKHQKFKSKYNLPMTLIADTDHAVCDLYGVYGEKKFMGKTYMGINRSTFLIDEDGKIKKIFNKVDVERHADEVLEAFGS